MADGVTSVGKIQLDVEFSKDSVVKEIKNLNSSINSGIKGSFSSMTGQMNGFVKNSLDKMMNSFKTFGNGGTESNKKVAQSTEDISSKIQQLTHQMESATNRAELHRQKLIELQAQYDRIKNAGLGDSDKARKLLEKITLAEDKVIRYGDVSDRTRLKIEQLEESMANLGETTNKSSNNLQNATDGAKKTGRSFKALGNEASKSSSKVGGFANMLTNSFMRVLKRIFILNLIYKAIRGLINYMNGALKTNKEFVSSLNTIKTNLRVAFQPIYDFILPALNALMRMVATVTTYIASAISALFGKSYKQSFDSAKGIEKSKKAMDSFGGSAKKAHNTLMGFDEINQLDISDDQAGGSGDHVMEMPDLATMDMTGIDRFKEIMAGIFDPFKKAWDSEGLNVINATRDAFEGIKGLIGTIGNSWREVWKNGTGVVLISNVLEILKEVLNLVGNIADTLRIAWETNSNGTIIIQNIADALNIVLGIFKEIGISLNNVWGEVGQKVGDIFIKALETTSEIIKKLGETLKIAWGTGGKYLFENLIKLAAKVVEVAGVIWNNFIGPVVKWLLDILAPVFGRVLNFAGAMVEGIIWWLDVLLKGLDKIREFAEKVVGFFQWLYDVIVGNSIIPDLVNEVTAWFDSLGKCVGEKVKALVDLVIKFFTDLWDGVKNKTINSWNSIAIFISNTTAAIGTNIDKFSKSFKTTWDTLWNGAKTVFTNMWDSLTGIVKSVINGIIGIVNKFIDFWNKIELKVPSVNIPLLGEVGGFSIGVPKLANIPMLARGGIIDQPTLAMVGERGKEAVIPFENSGFLEALTGSIVNALLQALPFLTGGQGSQDSFDDKEIVLNIEGMPLVRILLPLINDELTRLGYRTIFQVN